MAKRAGLPPRQAAIRVGSWVVGGFLVLLIALVIGARIHTAKSGFTIDITFSFLNNLSRRAPVLLSGGRVVGQVQEIFQLERQTYVRVYLDNMLIDQMPNRKETQFAIYTTNLMGQKYINISIPDKKPGDVFIKPGDIVRGISPPSIEQMLLSFSGWFEGKSVGQVSEEIFAKARFLQANLDAVAQENREDLNLVLSGAKNYFGTITEQFGNLKTHVSLIAQNSQDILTAQQQSLAELVSNTASMAKNLEQLEIALRSNRGSLGKLSNQSKELKENIRLTMEYSRSFLKCLQERPWVIIYKESCKQPKA